MGSPSPAEGATRLRVAVAPSGALLVDTGGADPGETSDGLTPLPGPDAEWVELVEIERVHRVPPGSIVLCRHGQSPS